MKHSIEHNICQSKRYRIYSNISKENLGEIELTIEQRDILTRAFQHRGMLHQDLALLIINDGEEFNNGKVRK